MDNLPEQLDCLGGVDVGSVRNEGSAGAGLDGRSSAACPSFFYLALRVAAVSIDKVAVVALKLEPLPITAFLNTVGGDALVGLLEGFLPEPFDALIAELLRLAG